MEACNELKREGEVEGGGGERSGCVDVSEIEGDEGEVDCRVVEVCLTLFHYHDQEVIEVRPKYHCQSCRTDVCKDCFLLKCISHHVHWVGNKLVLACWEGDACP